MGLHICEHDEVNLCLLQIAAKQGRKIEDVFGEVKELLADIGHTFTLKSIRLMAYLLRKVFRNIYSGIKVNMEGLNQVFLQNFCFNMLHG